MATKRRFDALQGPNEPPSSLDDTVPPNRRRASPRPHVRLISSSTPASSGPSPRLSPTADMPKPTPASSPRTYAADASIVLVGIRGTGKSTLGVLAASALHYQLVDADRHFYQTTGFSRAAYKSTYGAEEYRRQEVKATRSILLENPSKAVIVCGPGSIEGTGRRLLLDFARTHPVIFVERDVGEIQKHVSVSDTTAFSQLVAISRPVYRAISTFDFYNLSEPSIFGPEALLDLLDQVPVSLTLKKLERDFLQFISIISGNDAGTPAIQARHNLFVQQPDFQDFSYALHLPISGLAKVIPELRDCDLTADAIDLIIDLPAAIDGWKPYDHSIASFISKQYRMVQRSFQLPIIFEVQLPEITSTETSSMTKEDIQTLYFEVLEFGLRLAPDYLSVDISLDEQRVRRLVSAKGKTKIIGDYFDRDPGPDGWESHRRRDMFCRAEELGCDIARLYQKASSTADNIAVQQFRADSKQSSHHRIPLIAYNTGNLGRMSCCFNPILTPVVHPRLRSLDIPATSNWLLTVSEAQNALFASFVMDRMLFGIFGADVACSLSPAMHNSAFKLLGMPHEYKLFQRSTLEDFKGLAQDQHFGGASITAPFKQEIIPLIDTLSPDAQAIGAVNTLVPVRTASSGRSTGRNRAGHIAALHGENTDWKGIHTCIRRNLSPINAVRPRTTALVIGAGGMARAAVFAMIRLGLRSIFIYNRTTASAEQMARHFHGRTILTDSGETAIPRFTGISGAEKSSCRSSPPAEKSCSITVLQAMEPWPIEAQPPTIITSCIPGYSTDGSLVGLTLPHDWLGSQNGGVVVELAYNPVETALVKQARALSAQGWIVVDGLQVLPEQAILQFEMFTGRKAPRKLMRAEVLRSYKESARG